MSETDKWIDEKFRQVFEEETRGLERRKSNDPSCSLTDLEGILKNLYIMDGNDWVGRGQVQDTTLSATIAAYEQFIEEWKKDVKT